MPKVGTRAVANVVRTHVREGMRNELDADTWEEFPDGSTRFVFHHKPTGVVYKVNGYVGESWGNEVELENARALHKTATKGRVGKLVRIPYVSGYHFGDDLVVAMEYVDGEVSAECDDHPLIAELERAIRKVVNIYDLHPWNWKIDSLDMAVPVDLGSPMR